MKVKVIKRWILNSEQELDTFIKHLKAKGFHIQGRGNTPVFLVAFHYTADGTRKFDFQFKMLDSWKGKCEVTFHVDIVLKRHHKVSQDPKDMNRALKFIKLPDEFIERERNKAELDIDEVLERND